MNDRPMQVQALDPRDDASMAHWAAQLGVPVLRLHEAVAAIGTDLDKVKAWLAAPHEPGSAGAQPEGDPAW